MDKATRNRRTERMRGALNSSLEHLKNGACSLEATNLYSSEDQEFQLDTFFTRLEDLIEEIKQFTGTLPPIEE